LLGSGSRQSGQQGQPAQQGHGAVGAHHSFLRCPQSDFPVARSVSGSGGFSDLMARVTGLAVVFPSGVVKYSVMTTASLMIWVTLPPWRPTRVLRRRK